MSIFKPGDRIKLKDKHLAQMRHSREIVGTVRDIQDGVAYVALDEKLVSYNEEGDKIYFQEGFLEKKLEPFFEVVEESDWASIWDDSSS